MKLVKLLLVSLFIISCAHQEKAAINQEIVKYEVKNIDQIESDVTHLLENHPELTVETKEKVRAILLKGLQDNKMLKEKESKLAQHLITLTLVNKGTYGEIVKVRKEMNDNYKEKLKVFEKAALELKNVLGIEKPQIEFINESGSIFR